MGIVINLETYRSEQADIDQFAQLLAEKYEEFYFEPIDQEQPLEDIQKGC